MTTPSSLPPRLAEGSGPAADLLRRELRAGSPLDEAASWDGLLRRLGRAPVRRHAPMLLALGAGVFAGVVGLLVVSRPPVPARATAPRRVEPATGGNGPVAPAIAARVAPAAPVAPAGVRLTAAPIALPQAATLDLVGEARATASADAAALAFATDSGAVVQLFA